MTGEINMERKVLYNGQVLTLKKFWSTGELCLWIDNPTQITIPKMEFVGGYPNEYCIFIKNLTQEECTTITELDGSVIDLSKE